MYSNLLMVHSVLRWLVIAAGFIAAFLVLRAASERAADVGAAANARTAARLFVIAFDVQVLVGLLLYLRFSPITTGALQDMGAAMSNGAMRFWAVEHPLAMVVGLAMAHVGGVKLRGAVTPRLRRTSGILLAIATLLAVAATPWPFMPNGRPLW